MLRPFGKLFGRRNVNLDEGRVPPAWIARVHVYHADDVDVSANPEAFAAKVFQSVNPAMIEAFMKQDKSPQFKAMGIPRSVIADTKVFFDSLANQLPDLYSILIQPVETNLANAGNVHIVSLVDIPEPLGTEQTIVVIAREIQPATA